MKKENETFENPFKETIKTNDNDDLFNEWCKEENKRKQLENTPMSLDTFMKEFPAYKDLYDDMKYRYTVPHTYKAWIRCVELTKQRNERRKETGISDVEYYSMFNHISKDAAKLFAKYLNERKSQSSVNAVADKDIQDYTVEAIRNALNNYIGVSYDVDKEAYNEIFKLKKDEFEVRRLEVFKDVKIKVVEHFENLGFTLSERNLKSIDWWIDNYKVKY